MPIYEYSCDACGHAFERLAKTSAERDEAECPSCGSDRTERKLSVFGVGAEQTPRDAGPACANCPGSGSACPYS